MKTNIVLLLLVSIFTSTVIAGEISILGGLIQPMLLKGYNLEVDYKTDNWVMGYSHGWGLKIEGDTMVGEGSEQQLAYHLPYSTGLSIGPRLTNSLDIRVEYKIHQFNVYYENAVQSSQTKLISYKTKTLGLGLYHTIHPFDSIKSFTVSSSFRWWPILSSDLANDKFIYNNNNTGKQETLAPSNIGIANTPFILNVSVGFSF